MRHQRAAVRRGCISSDGDGGGGDAWMVSPGLSMDFFYFLFD
jgi:hypothetical protein